MKTSLTALLLGFCLHAGVWAQTGVEPSYPYLTQPRDTVIGVSRRLLTNAAAWKEVAAFNQLKNPNAIPIGITLRIPYRLLRNEGGAASVEQEAGLTRVGAGGLATELRAGTSVTEGTRLRTAPQGFAVVRLVDGSVLQLAGGSDVQIERARRYSTVGQLHSGVKLDGGRIEVTANKVEAGKPGFEVRTPQGLLGVRGTVFRVSVAPGLNVTAGEVLEGSVAFAGAAPDASARVVAAGFGTLIDAQQRVTEPTPLLPAPDTATLPTLQERLVVQFALPPQPGAAGYRGQLARDGRMREVLADNLAQGNQLRFADLEDGDYVLRVRAIDARGIEGLDATLPFRLKARPEPPLPTSPEPRGITRATGLELAWTENPQAQRYRLQVARDAGFAQVISDLPDLASASRTLQDLAPGEYYWRLASVRGAADQGPWGAVRAFVMRAPPKTPEPPDMTGSVMKFRWEGEPGQTFELQLARDARFTDLVQDLRLERPELDLAKPPSGTYYMRIKARDADGFQGPYTSPQRLTVPVVVVNCLRSSDGACINAGDAQPVMRP